MQTNWIGGRALASLDVERMAIRNPATEEIIDHIPRGCPDDVALAVDAARSAYPAWAGLSPSQRRDHLRAAALRLADHKEAVAQLLTRENGKPIGDARAEVAVAIDAMFSFSELAVHLRSGNQGAAATELNFQHREPRGVVACIVPWNFPLATGFGNAMPALAAGNTVIWKPSEKTPLSSRMLMELVFGELPPGVLNMLLGDGPCVGEHLVRHPAVDAIAFIGSERTGRHIGEICGRMLKKTILELGGKDPMIVDETVDVAQAARLAAGAAYANAGQICTSTERIYVHRAIFERFADALVAEATAIRMGDGMEPGTQMGPLIDALQLGKVTAQVDDAVRLGAELRCGGTRANRPGYFYPPTVLANGSPESLLMTEETFGPVAPLFAFDDFDQAIALANNSNFGLAAIVCTESSSRAIKALQSLMFGTVKINTMRGRAPGAASEPFKASGVGHGSGMDILFELTRQKAVHWRGQLV